LKVLQVSTSDISGGAEGVALQLHQLFNRDTRQSILLVGNKSSSVEGIFEINPDKNNNFYTQFFIDLAKYSEKFKKNKLFHYLAKMLRAIARPAMFYRWTQGYEEFTYKQSGKIYEYINDIDILHFHNLHGGYFDIRLLTELSKIKPIVLTLHDEWLYTGHCAYTLDCEKWQTTCGDCQYLDSYPAIRKDNTKINQQRKREIIGSSKLYIISPSKWLMHRISQSFISNSILEHKVINNGVDANLFKPADKYLSRNVLEIEKNSFVLLFIANHFYSSKAKDYKTVVEAVKRFASINRNTNIVFIAIGEKGINKTCDNLQIINKEYVKDKKTLSLYYQAADLYVNASNTETWGLTITEAMACGLPVVSTATGGICEQIINGIALDKDIKNQNFNDKATGVLVRNKDVDRFLAVIDFLFNNKPLLDRMSDNCVRHVKENYTAEHIANAHYDFYKQVLKTRINYNE